MNVLECRNLTKNYGSKTALDSVNITLESGRITGLLGLTDGSKDPTKVEMQLRAVLPPDKSNDFCHRMVLHGRAVCIARRPQCAQCTLRPWCDHFTKEEGKA